MIRKLAFFMMVLVLSSILSGCGNNPDSLFKKGKYAEAYTEFVKRGGTNEANMRREVTNGSFETRNSAGNQAIHDYYYAAECQKKLGNEAEARMYYQKVTSVAQYQIRVPHDKSVELRNSYNDLLTSIRNFRNREVELSSSSSGGGTDPYDNGGGTGNTDPYGGSTGGNTDPYSGGNSGGSNTDPYSGGSTTDPYNPVSRSVSNDSLYQMYYNSLRNQQLAFERLLYSTTAAEVPDIANLKREYEYVSRNLDNYLRYAAPNGILSDPNSVFSRMAYNSFESNSNVFQRTLSSAQGNISYKSYPLRIKEPNLVTLSEAAIGVASAPEIQQSLDTSAPEGVFSSKNESLADLVNAEQAMKDAYMKYQTMISAGKTTGPEVQKAVEDYKAAKSKFESLKAAQR